MDLPLVSRPRRTAHEREERRIRIMAMLRSGFSYEAIGREHQLTRERIRQIVVASLERKDSDTRVDQMRVQMARLEPALRIAARAVENGKVSAIVPLLKVLDRLDKYGAVAEAPRPYDGDARERLLAKLDRAAERYGIVVPHSGTPAVAAAERTSEPKNSDEDQFGFGGVVSPRNS